MQIADDMREDGSGAVVLLYWLISGMVLFFAVDGIYGIDTLKTCSAEVKDIALNVLLALYFIPFVAPFLLAAFNDNRQRIVAVIALSAIFAVLWNYFGAVVGGC